LLLSGTLLFAFGNQIRAMAGRTSVVEDLRQLSWQAILVSSAVQLLLAVYGGYFGAGIGFVILGMLAALGMRDVLAMGAIRTLLAAASNVRDIIASLDREDAPALVVVDSIQTMYLDTLDSAPGTVSQVRAAAQELIRVAKRRGFVLVLVGHVTKEGVIAGPRVLEHMVDTVLYFEGERGHQFRILRAIKNRFGATDEIGVFEMSDRGCRLEEQGRLADPGIAADQDRRARYEPAAANAVELDNAGLATRGQYARPGQADKAERATAAPGETPLEASARQLLAREFLDKAVPCAAAVAAPGPFGMEGRALLTNKASLLARHRFSSTALEGPLS